MIPSKSIAHRMILLGAVANRPSKIYNFIESDDLRRTVSAVEEMGARVKIHGRTLEIEPTRTFQKEPRIDCGESGTTLRLLLPLVASLWETSFFTGEGRLPERPLQTLVDVMEENGVQFSRKKLPFKTQGRLRWKKVSLPGNISSQYISGFLLSSIFQKEDCEICLTTELESKPYVDLTLEAMETFQIRVEETPHGYKIPKNQVPIGNPEIYLEGDWSNGAFFLVASAIGDGTEISVKHLDRRSRQGDRKILEILENFGAEILEDDGILVRGKNLQGQEIDLREIPDLLPILAILATKAHGTTTFIHGERLRYKESDRIQSTKEMIEALGGVVQETADGLKIQGTGGLMGGTVNSYKDHRIAMAAAVASQICENPVHIIGEMRLINPTLVFIGKFRN